MPPFQAPSLASLTVLLVAAAAVVVLMAVVFLVIGLRLGRRSGRLEAERAFKAGDAASRDDAVRRSRAVLAGQIGEQLAPWLPGFPCDAADVRFVGKPVDFVAFPGASTGSPREVVFIEVKAGDAKLSAPERALRQAVLEGRVRWVEYRAPVATKQPDG